MDSLSTIHGVVPRSVLPHSNDYLFRISLKAVIFNSEGKVLIVKERNCDWWDLPGGGMNHGESLKDALARELLEEVSLQGNFKHQVILAEDPLYSSNLNLYQMRITLLVEPENFMFQAGEDGDEIAFVDPSKFEASELMNERLIFKYCQLAKSN